MNQQQTAALQSMKEWLSHPGELGKEPSKIELAGEFDLHDLHYYIFKYKKGLLGKWLLGVCGGYEPGETEHCGHVFSEMEPYDPATAGEKAAAMVEMIRQYWMDQAKQFKENSGGGAGESSEPDRKHCGDGGVTGDDGGVTSGDDGVTGGDDGVTGEDNGAADGEDADETGAFTGFVLLSQPCWKPEQFKADMMADWGIECIEEEGDEAVETRVPEEPGRGEDGVGGSSDDNGEDGSILMFSVGNMRVVVALMEAPVPDGEAEANAANNYMWPEAVETVKTHQAQLIVAVLGQEAPIRERGLLFVKVMSVCCKQDTVLGIYTSGTVFQPEFYLEASEMMKEGGLPVLNWIYFGLYQTKGGWSTYTYGMKTFGKDEMEVLDVKADPQDVRGFLFDMVYYVLDADVTLRDGETIGFSEEQKLPITRSKGVGLDGYTLKIGYPEE